MHRSRKPNSQDGDTDSSSIGTLLTCAKGRFLARKLLAAVHLERVGGGLDLVGRAESQIMGSGIGRSEYPLATVEHIVGGNVKQGETVLDSELAEVLGDGDVDGLGRLGVLSSAVFH